MQLENILSALSKVRLAVIGDFCLDVYWQMDNSASEQSVETGLGTLTVKSQNTSLGGAGNVANNVKELGVGTVSVFGVIGNDPFGAQMRKQLLQRGFDVSGLFVQSSDWLTHTYIKPIENNQEKNRIDFGNFNCLSDETADLLIAQLEQTLPQLDAVIINQQVANGIHRNTRLQSRLQDLITQHPDTLFVLDSRDYSRRYQGTIRKLNAFEAALLCGRTSLSPREAIPLEDSQNDMKQLYNEWQRPVVISRGANGCLVYDGTVLSNIPALKLTGPLDTVGAGDSMVAGLTAALATGVSYADATTFATLVSAVTVQKLFQTGTASPDEIREIAAKYPEFWG